MQQFHVQRGIALLITLLTMSVLLGVTAVLLNVSIRQFKLSNIAKDSETAFNAASAGMECISYHDFANHPNPSIFGVNGDGSMVPEEGAVECMGETSSDIDASNNGTVVSGEEQKFQFEWGNNPTVCTDVSIFKFYDDGSDGDGQGDDMQTALNSTNPNLCPENATCTVIRARGYNVACGDIGTARTIERELVQRY